VCKDHRPLASRHAVKQHFLYELVLVAEDLAVALAMILVWELAKEGRWLVVCRRKRIWRIYWRTMNCDGEVKCQEEFVCLWNSSAIPV
jgi:hypothetical protein